MPEILTESFCERCGTRYTFEAAAPSRGRLGRLRVVSRGLRNYVLSDESSLEEAFAEARSDDERALTSQQLDAFHQTFNFCMSCRQYTCANCWNAAEGRCLTCAPHLGHEVLPAPFPTLDPRVGVAAVAMADGNGQAPEEAAWPVADLGIEPAAAAIGSEPEMARPQANATDDRAALAAAGTTAFLARFRPGESLDSALEAYEQEAGAADQPEATGAEAEGEVAVEAVAATAGIEAVEAEAEIQVARPEAEAVAATAAIEAVEAEAVTIEVELEGDLEAEMQVAAPEAEAEAATAAIEAVEAEVEGVEPVQTVAAAAAAAETRPQAAPEPEKPARLAAAATAWQVVAPDNDDQPVTPQPTPTPAWPPLPPGTEAPQWPTAPAWPAARSAGAGRSDDLLWAESSRDVLSPPPGERSASAVQPCVSCGLALSATARFCRRCGSQQG